MKNLISCFVLIVSFSASGQLFTKKDTLRFAPDSSYSRAIARYDATHLVIGTSKSGVLKYDETNGTSTISTPPVLNGEYRDVVVNDAHCIFSMISGDTGYLKRNCSNCILWTIENPGVFYDDIVLTKQGVVILGDPVNGHFFLRYINDSKSEINVPLIQSLPGEACYAGSGTTAQLIGKYDYCFVSGGGNAARFHRFSLKDSSTYFVRDLPMAKGDGAGPFSICFTDKKHGSIVGGNYLQPNDTTGTAVYSIDGGKSWKASTKQPGGYRCCVAGNEQLLFCAGSNGIDFSTDGGKTWNYFDKGYFCALLVEENTLYATSNKGYCIRYQLNIPH